ncbi:alcohol dehydrogenase catalytic domain-containing protein, partial [Halomonas sp. MG34]|nr:alcohol dehydrogenase catalytic domain-containing protein [Halomonas sp. MG34]
MKAVLMPEARKIEITNVDKPQIDKESQVLLKIKRVGICGSDMHIYHGTNPMATYPRIVGHEVTGEIVEVGSQVSSVAVGDRVVVEPIRYCGKCFACKNGRPNVCKELSAFGVHEDGGMREFAVLPENQVHRIDPTIDWDEAV